MMMNWCGIKFVEGPAGLLVPGGSIHRTADDEMGDALQSFGLAMYSLAKRRSEAEAKGRIHKPFNMAVEPFDKGIALKDNFRFTDDVPGNDSGMPEDEMFGDDDIDPQHSPLTDSTLEDFLED